MSTTTPAISPASSTAGNPYQPTCRFCGTGLVHTFADLGTSPLCQRHVTPARFNQAENFYPLHVYVCHDCFLVQLPEYVAREEIFDNEYAYFSSFSDTMLKHASDYADMMTARFGLSPKSFVVELASNDGYLLQYFVKKNIRVLGVEPTANTAAAGEKKGVPALVKFFGKTTATEVKAAKGSADVILGNNVLAHVPDINDFVGGVKILLSPTGVTTFEFPVLSKLIENNYWDTIYHEHFSYLSFTTVERIFAHHGLTLFDVEEIGTHGGSIRIFGRHVEDTSRPVTDRVVAMKSAEKSAGHFSLDYYKRFDERVKESKREILDFLIAARRDGKRVVAYGAPGKGNTLLNYCGIRTDFIEYTVDRSPVKQNNFLPGTRIPILSPDKIAETRPDYVFILPWNLKTEIMKQMAHVREWGGKFVVPLPRVEVL